MAKKQAADSKTSASRTKQPVRMLGSDVVVQSLLNHGIDTIFAYPGGYTMPLHQAFTRVRDQLRVVLPRQEQGGGFAAQGYARSTGKLGVCFTTSGPGATNLITTIADAKLDSIPMLAITGQVTTSVIGCDAFQETPIVEVCRSITKHHYLVTDPEDLPRIMKEAIHVATTGRPGPVLVDIPKNVQLTVVEDPDFDAPMQLLGYRNEKPLASADDIAKIAEAISQSKQPIIYAGGGIIASDASAELLELAEKAGIPVTTTMTGLTGFPGEHPLCMDMLGMHGSVYSNMAVSQADLLLSFGVRFDDRVTGNVAEFAKHGKIVHIDIDPSEINKIKTADVPVISDLKYALTELNKVVKPPKTDLKPWVEQCQAWKSEMPYVCPKEEGHIVPQFAVSELYRLAKDRNPIITTGVGQHQMWALQFYKYKEARTFLSSSGLGTMGFGLPSAMGAKVANPDRMVIDIDGDGSFQMNIQEMGTCHCEDIPVKVFLLNNQHLGMVMQWEDRFLKSNRAHTYLGPIERPETYGKGEGVRPDIQFPDFAMIAKGYGWETRHVSDPAELEEAINEMLDSDRPYLLDVGVSYREHVLPMIPAGGTVENIIKE